jgi:hypothetical protein
MATYICVDQQNVAILIVGLMMHGMVHGMVHTSSYDLISLVIRVHACPINLNQVHLIRICEVHMQVLHLAAP